MKRLTRTQIEADLLAGKSVPWMGANGKPTYLQLETPAQRRLYAFLAGSQVRTGKDLPTEFIDGLWAAFSEGDDPAAQDIASEEGQTAKAAAWRIKHLQTKNFGGIDSWNGPGFSWNLGSESWRLEGENGSGKSSLLSAIVFAFTGKRPRDDRNPEAHLESNVYGPDQKKLASWPPLASYPDLPTDLESKPEVRAIVTLENAVGETGRIGHGLSKGKIVSYSEGCLGSMTSSSAPASLCGHAVCAQTWRRRRCAAPCSRTVDWPRRPEGHRRTVRWLDPFRTRVLLLRQKEQP